MDEKSLSLQFRAQSRDWVLDLHPPARNWRVDPLRAVPSVVLEYSEGVAFYTQSIWSFVMILDKRYTLCGVTYFGSDTDELEPRFTARQLTI